MIQTVEHPTFSYSDFQVERKKPGISVVLRVRNEAEYAKISLESIADFFDEVILVYHECTDGTPEILAEFEKQDPQRIQVYHYLPKVFPVGSKLHRETPATSVHSFVYYSNFVLSKAAYQVRCAWDADQVADPKAMKRAVDTIRGLKRGTLEWWLSPWRLGYWWYIGVNLWMDGETMAVHGNRPLIGQKHDHAFLPAGRMVYYKRYPAGAYVFKRVLKFKYHGCLFYHLKGIKQDRGSSKYQLESNPDSLYKNKMERRWNNSHAITLDELQTADPRTREMPPPETLGIRPAGSLREKVPIQVQ